MYAIVLKKGCMFLGPQYGGMIGSSRSTSTTIEMDASS
jgi:hypothetical protein